MPYFADVWSNFVCFCVIWPNTANHEGMLGWKPVPPLSTHSCRCLSDLGPKVIKQKMKSDSRMFAFASIQAVSCRKWLRLFKGHLNILWLLPLWEFPNKDYSLFGSYVFSRYGSVTYLFETPLWLLSPLLCSIHLGGESNQGEKSVNDPGKLLGFRQREGKGVNGGGGNA